MVPTSAGSGVATVASITREVYGARARPGADRQDATLAALLTAGIAYVAHRRLLRGSRLLAFLATAPLAVPGIVLSIGLFRAYSRPPLLLYGTIWIIFVAYLTKYLPVAYTACHAAMATVHADLEDAARILGASRLVAAKTMIPAPTRISIPSIAEARFSIFSCP